MQFHQIYRKPKVPNHVDSGEYQITDLYKWWIRAIRNIWLIQDSIVNCKYPLNFKLKDTLWRYILIIINKDKKDCDNIFVCVVQPYHWAQHLQWRCSPGGKQPSQSAGNQREGGSVFGGRVQSGLNSHCTTAASHTTAQKPVDGRTHKPLEFIVSQIQ